MGDTASRLTGSQNQALNRHRLSQRQMQYLLSNFGLNELSPPKARISLLAFLHVYPEILQPHAALLLPAIRDMSKYRTNHALSFTYLSSSSIVNTKNAGKVEKVGVMAAAGGVIAAAAGRTTKGGRDDVQSAAGDLPTLQDMVDVVSACTYSDNPDFEQALLRRFSGRVLKACGNISKSDKQFTTIIEDLTLHPYWAAMQNNNSQSNSGIISAKSNMSLRSYLALLQILAFGYIELLYILSPTGLLFSDATNKRGSSKSNLNASGRPLKSNWDKAPQLYLSHISELDFGFILRAFLTSLYGEENISVDTRNEDVNDNTTRNSPTSSSIHRVASPQDRPAISYTPSLASSAPHASTTKQEIVYLTQWILNTLPLLPAVLTSAVQVHLLGELYNNAPERQDSSFSSSNLQYSVYGKRQGASRTNMGISASGSLRSTTRSSGNESTTKRRSASAEALAQSSKGWKGDGILEARSKCLTDEQAFVLRLTSSIFSAPMKSAWTCLYASWKHGNSLSRLASCTFLYPAPMVLVIKTAQGNVLGAVIASELKDGGHFFYGDPSTFLFAIHPEFKLIKAGALGRNYIYLNLKNKFHPIGLGFGGQVGGFRLWIGDELKDSYVTASDCTYGSTPLLDPMYGETRTSLNKKSDCVSEIHSEPCESTKHVENEFLIPLDIKELEVWGTGDSKAKDYQMNAIKRQEQMRQERRQVDKGRMAGNEFDREYLLGNTFNRAHPEPSAV